MLPQYLVAKSTGYDYFKLWRDDGTFHRINSTLVGAVRQLHAKSENAHPSAASIDSQTVKSSERSQTRGYDGGKMIKGRKRNIAADTLELLLAAYPEIDVC